VGNKRPHHVCRTLYDCFDARTVVDADASIRYEWDGYLISSASALPIRSDAKMLINRAWTFRNRSPFKGTQEPDDLPHPPRDWQRRLLEIVGDSMQTLTLRARLSG
jgi:hypothetical protein